MKPSGNISKRAFTLVELLVVMAIIGILVTVTMGIYGSVKRKGAEFRLRTELAGIELALEKYKADPVNNGQYPPGSGAWNWNTGGYQYPPKDWNGASPGSVVNNGLYSKLVTDPMAAGKKPYLPDVKESQHMGADLLAPVADMYSGLPSVKWYYNSADPKYNNISYDLWVEYGDLGKDKGNPSDDTVKVISNWNN